MLNLDKIESDTLDRISRASSVVELETIRVSVLGKKGVLYKLLRSLGSIPLKDRKSTGSLVNGIKDRLTAAFAEALNSLTEMERRKSLLLRRHDVTLPVNLGPTSEGRIHPISKVLQDVSDIFSDMGFSFVDGPDIETDYHNFTALNFPRAHPARREHDTFFFKPIENQVMERSDLSPTLLRTHTSSVQIRTMESNIPPMRIFTHGHVYRRDSDQTHTPMFHQIEGFIVDNEVTISTLKWVLLKFCSSFFEVSHVDMRFRPSFFPFTEPSMEVDIRYHKEGHNLEFGHGNSWLEILGCGMIHPNVLRSCGIDPSRYQGFAFGLGADRLAMLKYGIADLRDCFNSDIHWIRHYGSMAIS